MSLRSRLAPVLLVLIPQGCTDPGPIPEATRLPMPATDIRPACTIGCIEEDEFPNKPGVFLGSGVTPDLCFGSGYTDRDQDLLGDFCEEQLIWAFAPELASNVADDVGAEPYWAARREDYLQSAVQLMYLLAYHVDLGEDDPLCHQNVTPSSWCDGHYGDSEWIQLTVYYHATWKHWILWTARYSAHDSFNVYDRGSGVYPTALTYPDRAGAHPRAYVSYRKHANYASISECDAAVGGFEDCFGTFGYARVPTAYFWNVGSFERRLVDCVGSRDPIYQGNGVQECLWSGTAFGGWTGNEPSSDPYRGKLMAFDF